MSVATAPHVLIIDDDPLIRDMVAEYLRNNDMRASTGATGAEMFEAF